MHSQLKKFTKYKTYAKCTNEGNLQNMKPVQNAQLNIKTVQNAQLKEIYNINPVQNAQKRKFTKYETSARCTIEENLQNRKQVQNAELYTKPVQNAQSIEGNLQNMKPVQNAHLQEMYKIRHQCKMLN